MMDRQKLQKIYERNILHESSNYSTNACRNEAAYRQQEESHCHMRTPFAVDRDRILHSGAYRRYQGKTQVFSFTNMFDEETSNRSLHTTYVSQISRTIGKMLHMNVELVEAIALGHDLGHSPFGHDGEISLSKCCLKYDIGMFHHNIESLYIVDYISRQGQGLNLTFQVRDGIISHDGEVHNTLLKPQKDKSEQDIQNYISRKKAGEKYTWMPATLEGCIVRISDTIAYIGQDIEDAIRLNILKREDIPRDCAEYLGDTNSQIIDTLVKSVILNSYDNDFIAFDDETSRFLLKLKKFNYQRIYTDPNVKSARIRIDKSMEILFEQYMQDLVKENFNSKIYTQFLNSKNKTYLEKFSDAEKVRDFIATMTDRYYNEEVKNYFLPGSFY
jgi:dGTPase